MLNAEALFNLNYVCGISELKSASLLSYVYRQQPVGVPESEEKTAATRHLCLNPDLRQH